MALLSWSKPMDPLLPLLARPLAYPDDPTQSDYAFGKDHPVLGNKADLEGSAKHARDTLAKHHAPTDQPSKLGDGRTIWDKSNEDEAARVDTYGSDVQAITDHLSEQRATRRRESGRGLLQTPGPRSRGQTASHCPMRGCFDR